MAKAGFLRGGGEDGWKWADGGGDLAFLFSGDEDGEEATG